MRISLEAKIEAIKKSLEEQEDRGPVLCGLTERAETLLIADDNGKYTTYLVNTFLKIKPGEDCKEDESRRAIILAPLAQVIIKLLLPPDGKLKKRGITNPIDFLDLENPDEHLIKAAVAMAAWIWTINKENYPDSPDRYKETLVRFGQLAELELDQAIEAPTDKRLQAIQFVAEAVSWRDDILEKINLRPKNEQSRRKKTERQKKNRR